MPFKSLSTFSFFLVFTLFFFILSPAVAQEDPSTSNTSDLEEDISDAGTDVATTDLKQEKSDRSDFKGRMTETAIMLPFH